MDLLMHRMWVRRKDVARPLPTSPRWETLAGEDDLEVRVDPSVRPLGRPGGILLAGALGPGGSPGPGWDDVPAWPAHAGPPKPLNPAAHQRPLLQPLAVTGESQHCFPGGVRSGHRCARVSDGSESAPDPQRLLLVLGTGPRGLRQRLGPGVWSGVSRRGLWSFQEGMAGGAGRGKGQACVGACVSLHPCAQCVRVCMGLGWHMDQRGPASFRRHTAVPGRRQTPDPSGEPSAREPHPPMGEVGGGGGATFISSPRRLCAGRRGNRRPRPAVAHFPAPPAGPVQAPPGPSTVRLARPVPSARPPL